MDHHGSICQYVRTFFLWGVTNATTQKLDFRQCGCRGALRESQRMEALTQLERFSKMLWFRWTLPALVRVSWIESSRLLVLLEKNLHMTVTARVMKHLKVDWNGLQYTTKKTMSPVKYTLYIIYVYKNNIFYTYIHIYIHIYLYIHVNGNMEKATTLVLPHSIHTNFQLHSDLGAGTFIVNSFRWWVAIHHSLKKLWRQIDFSAIRTSRLGTPVVQDSVERNPRWASSINGLGPG